MSPVRAAFGLLLAYTAFIVYGSLVPLDFSPLPLDEAWRRFQAMPFLHLGVESRADWIANGVLYLPLGFLAAWWLRRLHWWRAAAAVAAVVLGVALALGVEFAQVFFPPRTVSLNDVLAETIGSVLGALPVLAPGHRRMARPTLQHAGVRWIEAHALSIYAAGYLAFCLFPYDVLISRAEVAQKLASDLWGWWIAGQDGRPLVVALQLGVEAALTVPLGVMLGGRGAGRPAASYGRAVLVGLALGLGIELAQLMIASGVTQGASVLSRVAGMVAGLALWRRRERWSAEGLRAALARTSLAWAPLYALLVLAVNGWFAYDWLGEEAAVVRWHEVRFLPFYYHYYTTEAHALFSLTSVMLMYLPVGVLAWAWRRPARTAALWGAALSAVIEASKLWLAGLHPDPTNLWIAAAACWGIVAVADGWPPLRWAFWAEADAAPVGSHARSIPAAVPRRSGAARAAALLGAALLPILLYLGSAPALATASALVLAACAAVVWLRPLAAVLIVPALLPVLDLAPWTGRFFCDEFDLLLIVCLTVAYLRSGSARQRWARDPWRPAFALLALSIAMSTSAGAMPWPWPDSNTLTSYYSPYNALRIAKGALWAWLYVGLLRRLEGCGYGTRRALASGMALGLAYVVAFVAWERLAFVGLFDFADEYRVTGPFSAMHRGGAFIECYIAMTMPFVALHVLEARQWVARAAGAMLLLGTSYAMMVTFSRSGYAAFGTALVLFFVLSLARSSGTRRQAWLGGLLVAGMLAVAVTVLLGPFAQQRLAHWGQDLTIRQAHWSDALAMRDTGLWTAAFGMGVGRFPETHFWRSREPARAASYSLESDGATHYLRLAGGAGRLYIDQIVADAAAQSHVLKLRLRANKPAAPFELSLCEKWMLTSRSCVTATVHAGDTPGAWSSIETTLNAVRLAEPPGRWPRPVKLSLNTPAEGTVVDVTDIGLQAADGRDLLSNGDFNRGLDRWFFSTDLDPPWHIHSLPVTVLFDQGWFGAVAWALLLVTAIYHGGRLAWHGDRNAVAALAALVAFLVVGSVNTLIDEPRFLFLLLVTTALCCAPRRAEPRSERPGGATIEDDVALAWRQRTQQGAPAR
jgi:glycopeptide antibiotics resistance protein